MTIKMNKQDFKKYTSNEVFDKIVDIKTINQLLKHCLNNYSHSNAVAKPDGSLVVYKQLIDEVAAISSYFKSNNIRNKNIGLYCNNNYNFEVISLGVMASGNTVVLLPKAFNKQMLQAYIKDLDIVMLISDDYSLDIPNHIYYESLLHTKPLNDPFVESNPDDPAAIILTSGTTGKPKGAILSHDNLMAGTINGCYGLKHVFNQIYYCILPLTHSFGFIRNMLTALYTGSLIYYCNDKSQLFRDLPKYKPTVLVIVPTLAEIFLNIMQGFGKNALGGRINTIICGSANVPPYLSKNYAKLDITFCPGYGLTECSNIVTGNPEAVKYSDSVGLLFPDQEAKLIDDELCLRGRTLFKGYYNNPTETSKALSDGWFHTGDLARFDDNGHIYIIGRIKDIIVLPNGENVSPAYVESKINTLDLIKDCLVYDKVNEFGNTMLFCELTLREAIFKSLGSDIKKAHEMIKKHINEVNASLLPHEQIFDFIIRDKDFDRSPAMKIIRKKH